MKGIITVCGEISPIGHHADVKRRPLARLLHRSYKVTLSPFVGKACRFQPTCSDYALEAVEKHGWLRGGAMAIRRIIRCNPCCPAGNDPVP